MGTRLIRSKWRICSLHGNHMSIFCATLCKKQIIFSIQLVNMRSLRTDSAASMTDTYTFGQLFSCVWIDFTHKNSIPVIFISGSRGEVNIFTIKQQSRINPSLINPYRLWPFLINIAGMYNQMSLMWHIGSGHKKLTVMVTEHRRINSAWRPNTVQIKLLFISQTVIDQLPVHKILTVVNRHSRIEFKSWIYKIKIIPDSANRRIWIVTGNNGIFVFLYSDIWHIFPPDLQTDKCGSLHKISIDYYDSEGITTLKTFAVLQEKLYKRHCKYG